VGFRGVDVTRRNRFIACFVDYSAYLVCQICKLFDEQKQQEDLGVW
jgi:hypothetical protein